MRINLRDRVLVVTGASAGIGAATALQAARRGMHVVLAARRMDRLETLAREIEALGRRALPVACDVNRDAAVTALVQRTLEHFGRLDVMFANAGYGLYRPADVMTDAELRAIFETNFFGTVRCIQAAIPILREQPLPAKPDPSGPDISDPDHVPETIPGYRGQLVICSSAASEVGVPMYAAYAATKAAQDGYASSLRAELADEGIFVTTVHPVPTTTEFFDAMKARHAEPEKVQHSPAPVTQTAAHVARCIVHAMSRPTIPEVWPHWPTRLGAGLATAFPRLPAWALRRHMRKLRTLDPNLRLPRN